jgi:hypothetical protein
MSTDEPRIIQKYSKKSGFICVNLCASVDNLKYFASEILRER